MEIYFNLYLLKGGDDMNDEQIKNTDTSAEMPVLKSNPLFDTLLGFDDTFGFTPFCEFE
jgi:hypothetical protein